MSARDALTSLQARIRTARGREICSPAAEPLPIADLPFTAARRPRPETIRIVAGQDHPDLPAMRLTGRRANFAIIDEIGLPDCSWPLDYAEPDEPAEAPRVRTFDNVALMLLGSITALGIAALWLGLCVGAS